MATRVSGLNAAGQAVLMEDLENPWIDDIEGYERFQRTAPAVKGSNGGPIGNHIYAENPRQPNKGKQYMAIHYRHQDYPMAVYQPRIVHSVNVQNDLLAILKAPEKKQQDLWEEFLDRLVKIELEIDFRQLALPDKCPDKTALRMLSRTLTLQVQSAESEEWRTKNHPKTYQDYKMYVKTPIMRTVRDAEELKTLGKGWFKAPTCTPETEIAA